jgi:hypothetical protein
MMILPGVTVLCVNRCIGKDQFAANSHFPTVDSGFNDLRESRAPGIVYGALSSQSDNLRVCAGISGRKVKAIGKSDKNG